MVLIPLYSTGCLLVSSSRNLTWSNSKMDTSPIQLPSLARRSRYPPWKFRGKFLYYLKQLYYQNKLEFHGSQKYLFEDKEFEKLLSSLYGIEWIVYCKPPFKNAACVVEYLGRYTHRVAISNKRIVSIEKDTVTFNWRDYKDNSKHKVMTLSAEEFIRRFLIHILPSGFMKIRHYGLLGNRNKTTKLKICKQLTHTSLLIREKASNLKTKTKKDTYSASKRRTERQHLFFCLRDLVLNLFFFYVP